MGSDWTARMIGWDGGGGYARTLVQDGGLLLRRGYCFQDSDGDGVGDLRGLMSRLDYLSRLGVTCLWLNPIHPTPHRDDGYDVADYYAIRGWAASVTSRSWPAEADQRGIRLLLDLVVNHTSNEPPWFQSAPRSGDSPYRDWYVWSDTEPADRRQGIVFPGEQRDSGASTSRLRLVLPPVFDFQPDLNWANPKVRAEIKKVMGFWLGLGASGFRVDAAPFVLEQVRADVDPAPKDFTILDDWRESLQWIRGDAVLLCRPCRATT
jgi:maltose alpha-D-glucosyltransferase / alpha-amylase